MTNIVSLEKVQQNGQERKGGDNESLQLHTFVWVYQGCVGALDRPSSHLPNMCNNIKKNTKTKNKYVFILISVQ